MKKIINSILIMVILCNFIFPRFVYATTIIDNNSSIDYSEESYNQLLNGTGTLDGNSEEVSETTSSAASMVGTQTSLIGSLCVVVATILRLLVNQGGFYYTESDYSAANVGWFSVNSLVFGEYLLFNVNLYQTNESLNPDVDGTAVSNMVDSLKETVSAWFQIIRLFAIALIILLLMFTVMRLAVADLAEDRARYKEVLKSWAIGLLFIFLLPYIIASINTICDYLMDILWDARLSLEEAKYASFESELFVQCLDLVASGAGLKSGAYFIELLAFIIMDCKFFFKYFKRSFKVFMLIVLSPIVGVMHIFSKIKGGDGIIGNWTSQYLMNILMQPLHALVYLIFMFVASNIAINAPLIAVLFIWGLSRAEKIIQIILEIDYGKITSLFSK